MPGSPTSTASPPPLDPGQAARLRAILAADPLFMEIRRRALTLALPDAWLTSGIVYQTVWNALTRRPSGHGLKDADLIYFDPDLTWESEDAVIRHAAAVFADCPLPVEIRNQARVHLWYEARFGRPYGPPLACATDSLHRYLARTHAVAVALDGCEPWTLAAPFGLDDVFALRLARNPGFGDAEGHRRKAARMLAVWPELRFEPG